jgi:alpha-D-ribose 1-methylphosphonate 5-triphosphate synthase subunit PhnG
MPSDEPALVVARQRWLSILARSDAAQLEAAWNALPEPKAYRIVRRAEVGLVMVRARAGGSGQAFNLGEATVSRCAVSTEQGFLGVGYVQGRRTRHAERVAAFDALLQDPARRGEIERDVLAPLAAAHAERSRRRVLESAATKVEFFTVARGDNP